MNYEEKYKQALKVASQWHKDGIGDVKTIVECIFPELHESEDEKIIKEIISIVKSYRDSCITEGTHRFDDCIAWLEKQGEKPVERDTEIHDLWVYIREWNDKFGRLPVDENELEACIDYVMKRQKPSDKVEQSCYHNDGLYYAIDILEKTFGKVEGYQSDDGIIEHQTAIETVNALYHKKPAEWSEEDKKMKSLIISTLTSMGTLNLERYHHMNLDEVKNWLTSLKDRVQPQPRQEWSKEDEEMFCSLKKLLNEASCYSCTEGSDKILNWLKSFKPNHWKLSEVKNETKNKCPNYSEGYGCSTSPLKQCDTCPDYKLYNHLTSFDRVTGHLKEEIEKERLSMEKWIKLNKMTREELIYLGAIQLFAAYESNPPKVDGKVLPTRGLIENQALEIAASMYGKLPKYVKYAKKQYKKEKEDNQITDEEIE